MKLSGLFWAFLEVIFLILPRPVMSIFKKLGIINIYIFFDITKHKPTRLLPKFWAKTEKIVKCLSPPQRSG